MAGQSPRINGRDTLHGGVDAMAKPRTASVEKLLSVHPLLSRWGELVEDVLRQNHAGRHGRQPPATFEDDLMTCMSIVLDRLPQLAGADDPLLDDGRPAHTLDLSRQSDRRHVRDRRPILGRVAFISLPNWLRPPTCLARPRRVLGANGVAVTELRRNRVHRVDRRAGDAHCLVVRLLIWHSIKCRSRSERRAS